MERILLLAPLKPASHWNYFEHLYSNINHQVYEYDSNIKPYNIIQVNPEKIKNVTGRMWKPWANRKCLFGNVMGGNWDKKLPPDIPEDRKPYPRAFNETVFHKSIKNRYVYEKDWSETELYHWLITVRNEEANDLKPRFRYLDSLYEDIKQNGYCSQKEIFDKKKTFIDSIGNEILVDVGRNGELLFVDGRHRLSMAKILGLNKIPVAILVRHKNHLNKAEESCKFR